VRRRIVFSTLTVALVVALVFGLPLAVIGSRYLEAGAQERAQTEADRVARVVDSRVSRDQPVEPEDLDNVVSGTRYVVIDLPEGGGRTFIGETMAASEAIRADAVGRSGVGVTVYESRAQLDRTVRTLRLVVLGVGMLALATALLFSWIQSRRLSDPLKELARSAARLGSGDPTPHLRRYGVPELDMVAETLDSSAERVASMLAAERQFASNASHQLRTPLTALSMRLEEILSTGDFEAVREEAAAALAQVERLALVVDRLLTHSRQTRAASAVALDVDAVVAQQVQEWRKAYQKAGRRLVVEGLRGLRAMATPGGFAQVLATLVENSLVHGAGTVTIRVRETSTSVVVEVSDEGSGVPPELGQRIFEREVSGRHSTGLGLSVARDLAEADGGRLELRQAKPPVFALFLAAAEPSALSSRAAAQPAGATAPARAGLAATMSSAAGPTQSPDRRARVRASTPPPSATETAVLTGNRQRNLDEEAVASASRKSSRSRVPAGVSSTSSSSSSSTSMASRATSTAASGEAAEPEAATAAAAEGSGVARKTQRR
jgi:signal transduction histidine kinase